MTLPSPDSSRATNIKLWWFAVVLIILSIPLIQPKGSIVLWINSNNSPALDFFFKYFTHLGDGLVFAFLSLVLLFINYRYAFMSIAIGILHSLFVNLFKRGIFIDSPRPRAFFDNDSLIHFVEGVEVHTKHSFPSGHTTTAFAAALLLMIMTRGNTARVLILIVAALVGYSRMYLFLHFYQDVFAGMCLGLLSTALIWYAFQFVPQKNWMQKGIIDFIK